MKLNLKNNALIDLLARAGWTGAATGAALLIADGAARGVTHISIPEYKAAGLAAAAAALTALKTVVSNYLNTHQSLKSQVAALQAQVNANAETGLKAGPLPPAA